MKRYLIILAFLPLTLISWGQITISELNGLIWTFQGKAVTFTIPSWADTIFNDYVSINNHFSQLYQDEIEDYFNIVLDEDYIMPDASDNYYKVFGHEGLGKKTADWLHFIRTYDTLFQSTLSVPKTGDVMKWQIEDSIYLQNDIPNHKMRSTGQGLLTSTDGFTGINGTVYMGATTFTGEFPTVDWGFNRLFINANSYFGTFPNIQNSTCQRITIGSNYFSGFEGASGFVNNNFQQLIANENEFTAEALETLFYDFNDWWVVQNNPPTQTVTINVSGGISATPNTTTQGYITAIEAKFDASAFTITILTN
jgi:hypothetical protein